MIVGKLVKDPERRLEELTNCTEDIIKEQLVLTKQANIVVNYEYARTLVNDHHDHLDKTSLQKELLSRPRGEHSLIAASNESWERLQGALMPMFSGQSLQEYFDSLVEIVETFLATELENDRTVFSDRYRELTLDILMESFFHDPQQAPVEELQKLKHLARTHNQLSPLMILKMLLPEFVPTKRKRVLNAQRDRIDRELSAIGDSEEEGILGQLLAHDDVTEQEAFDTIKTLLMAGKSSTALGMIYSTYEIVTQGYQEPLREELRAIEEPIEFADLHQLSYLDQLINETLRHRTVIPFISRLATADIETEEFSFEAGDSIFIPIMSIHKHPKYWDEPEAFNPERWADRNKNTAPLMPFGIGPRKCLGEQLARMSMRLLHYKLFRNHHVEITRPDNLDTYLTKSIEVDSDIVGTVEKI
jgi:cytochrome P450